MFEIGQLLDNQYIILSKHRGRHWVVYIALDRISENIFVVKAPSYSSPGFSPRRFREKAKRWIDLGQCDQIVTAFMLKNFDGAPHLFMEYIEGPALSDMICSRPGRPLPVGQIIPLMKEIIGGMKSLHGARMISGSNLIHGNLCAHNILTKSGNIKITDIGLAASYRMPGGMANAAFLLRDLPCMAPEQIEDPNIESPLADIYSFGAVIYEAATGTAPTLVTSSSDPLAKYVLPEPAPPRARNRQCPKWLDEAILKCMAKKPENRFQSFKEIEEFVGHLQKIPATPEPEDRGQKSQARTSRVARARGIAKKESGKLNHYYLGVEHIVLGILAEEEAMVLSSIDDAASAPSLRSEIISSMPKGEGPWQWDGIIKTPRYRRVMKMARKIRREYSDERMLPQHILLAVLLEGQNVPVRAMRKLGVNIDSAVKKLRKELSRRRPVIMVTDSDSKSSPFMSKMSCIAGAPYFTPFVGRDTELERARELILDEKRGIIIVGNDGVGKTSFMQQLTCFLSDAASGAGVEVGSIYKLRSGALLASDEDGEKITEYFLDAVSEVIDSASILLIEDLPTLLSIDIKIPPKTIALEIEDAVSAQGLLLAATATPSGYDKCEAENESLLSLLGKIALQEPSNEETLTILRGAKQASEVEYSVTISNDALEAAISVCAESAPPRALPAGAIELLDSACAVARYKASLDKNQDTTPIRVTAREIQHISKEKIPCQES